MIGAMKHRVTFQERVLSPDGGGGHTESWRDIALNPDVFAALEVLTASETLRFGQLDASLSARFVVRHRKDITPDMRLKKGSDVYNILSVADRDGQGVYLDILGVKAS